MSSKIIIGAEVDKNIAETIEKLAKLNYCSKSAIVRRALAIGLKEIEKQVTHEIKGVDF